MGFREGQIFEYFQVLLNGLNRLHSSNFGAFGGPMARATWA